MVSTELYLKNENEYRSFNRFQCEFSDCLAGSFEDVFEYLAHIKVHIQDIKQLLMSKNPHMKEFSDLVSTPHQDEEISCPWNNCHYTYPYSQLENHIYNHAQLNFLNAKGRAYISRMNLRPCTHDDSAGYIFKNSAVENICKW